MIANLGICDVVSGGDVTLVLATMTADDSGKKISFIFLWAREKNDHLMAIICLGVTATNATQAEVS